MYRTHRPAVRVVLMYSIQMLRRIKYLSLTEFEVRTVSYGPSFFLLRLMAQVRLAINRRGKTSLARYLLYISVVRLTGSGTISIREEWIQISEACRSKAKRVNLKSYLSGH